MAARFSLDWWATLEFLGELAKKCVKLQETIVIQALPSPRADDNREATVLLEMLHHLDDAGRIPSLHVQSEWLGGDSGNPKNYTLRPPAIGLMRRFPRAEVDAYRDAAGNIRLPHLNTGKVFVIVSESGGGAHKRREYVQAYLFEPAAMQRLTQLRESARQQKLPIDYWLDVIPLTIMDDPCENPL